MKTAETRMGLFYCIKKTWETWKEVKAERKNRDADKQSKLHPLSNSSLNQKNSRLECAEKAIRQRAEIQRVLGDSKNDDFGSVVASLESIAENNEYISSEEQLSSEEVKNILYTAAKKQAALVYDKSGIGPANLDSVVQNVARAQEKLVGEPLDKNALLAYFHRDFLENTQLSLISLRGNPHSIKQAEGIAQKAMHLLDLGAYSPAEKAGHEERINKLLAQNFMGYLKFFAINGLALDFEGCGKRFMNLVENANLNPVQRKNAEAWLNEARVSCYNNQFMNYTAAFNAGVIALQDLIVCARDNNQAVEEAGMPKDGSVRVYARITPAAYKLEIERLLCSIDPETNRKRTIAWQEARTVLNKVKQYIAEAELTERQTVDLNASISRMRAAYKKHGSDGQKPWGNNGKKYYKNPPYERTSRRFTKQHR